MESTASAATRSSLDLACVEVHGRVYGVDVLGVREIVHDAPVTPLPKAPSLIEGVVDLRGRMLPVFDLGRTLGGEPVAGDSARIAVLEVGGLVLGMRVTAAVDVLSVEEEQLQAPAGILAGGGPVRAVVRRSQAEPVLVLGLESLLEAVRGSAPPECDA